MNKILIITTGSLAILLIIAYLLYSKFIRQAKPSFYRQKGNKKSDRVKEEIHSNEKLLKTYQELITITVKCRNLVQKISLEYNNLITQLSPEKPLLTIELLSLSMFLDDNEIIITDLKNFKAKNKAELPEEVNSFLNQIINYMIFIHDTIKTTSDKQTNRKIDSNIIIDFNMQITDIFNKLIDLHKWIINYFQQFFATMQST